MHTERGKINMAALCLRCHGSTSPVFHSEEKCAAIQKQRFAEAAERDAAERFIREKYARDQFADSHWFYSFMTRRDR